MVNLKIFGNLILNLLSKCCIYESESYCYFL